MTLIDILIIMVFLGGLGFGFYRGILSQLGSLGGMVLGIIACQLFGGVFGDLCQQLFSPTYSTRVIAVIILFVIVYIAVRLLAGVAKTVVKAVHLGILDRIAGGVFTCFKWVLALSFVLNIWSSLFSAQRLQDESSLADGRVVEAVLDLAPATLGWIQDKVTNNNPTTDDKSISPTT